MAAMVDLRFQIKKSKITSSTLYYFRARAKNGEILFHSEMYARKQSIKRIINKIIKAMAGGSFEVQDMTGEKHGK